MTTTAPELGSASAVLGWARARGADADRAEADLMVAGTQWADLHPAESLDAAAVLERFGDQAVAIAGPGAPLVTEFSVAEFAAALRLPTEVGRRQLGEALELRHRLPKTWARMTGGDLPAWRARRIARETICLSRQAAGYVDRQVAPFAHRIRPAELDRLVQDAICRFMPEEAERRRTSGADGRYFAIEANQVSFVGTSVVHGELDLADALDLETAVASGAATLKTGGSEESLDVRRSQAVGELARRQLSLDLAVGVEPCADRGQGCDRPPARQVVLHVHLSEAAVTGAPGHHTARVEHHRLLVTAEQVAHWCGQSHTNVVVKPVIDLAEHIAVTQYEVPDRLTDQVVERDLTCVFPWCSRPARGCDTDHVVAFAAGGATASDNLAALCRRHHRLKTFGSWSYTALEPGAYLWSSPHGLQFLRDHSGTTDVSHQRRRSSPDP